MRAVLHDGAAAFVGHGIANLIAVIALLTRIVVTAGSSSGSSRMVFDRIMLHGVMRRVVVRRMRAILFGRILRGGRYSLHVVALVMG